MIQLPHTTIFVDTETGGTLPRVHPLIQVAAVAVSTDWRELESIELRIQFDPKLCDPEALQLIRVDPVEWNADAEPSGIAIARFDAFLNRHRVVPKVSKAGRGYNVARLAAYNAPFDGEFLRAWYDRHDRFAPWDLPRCVMQRALWWCDAFGQLPESFKLADVAKLFGVELPAEEAHDAFADVRATVELARRVAQTGVAA